MSNWISLSYDIYNLSSIIIGIIIVLLGIGIYRCRSLVYSIYLLAGLGFSVAAFISLLGFQVVGAVHIIIYVGAALLFFIVTLSMMGDIKIELYDTKYMVPLGIVLFLIMYYTFQLIVNNVTYTPGPTLLEGEPISRYMVENYLPQLFIAILAMGTTVVESLAIAKKEILGEKE